MPKRKKRVGPGRGLRVKIEGSWVAALRGAMRKRPPSRKSKKTSRTKEEE